MDPILTPGGESVKAKLSHCRAGASVVCYCPRWIMGQKSNREGKMAQYKPTPEVVTSGRPRTTAQVRLNGQKILEAPVGTTLESYLRMAETHAPVPIVAALINGKLSELSTPILSDVDVMPVTMSSTD